MSRAAVTLVEAEAAHVPFLARHMRAIDRAECRAMGHDPAAALRNGLALSDWALTALVGGEPHAMFGRVVASVLGGHAVPWFLGTDMVRCHGRSLLRLGPDLLARMRRPGWSLANYVSADNRQAIRLLERWGFTVEQPLVVVGTQSFRRFSLDALAPIGSAA